MGALKRKGERGGGGWNPLTNYDYQKALEKLTSFFLLNPLPFNEQSYQKQKGPGTRDQPLFRLQNKFRKIISLVIDYLNKFDDLI